MSSIPKLLPQTMSLHSGPKKYMYYADLNTQYDALLHWIVSTHGVLSWPVTPQLSDNV